MEKNIVNRLPCEIWLDIFSYLSAEDIINCIGNVCRRWEDLSRNHALWRHKEFKTVSKAMKASGRSSWQSTLKFLSGTPKVKNVILSKDHTTTEAMRLFRALNKCTSLRHLEIQFDFIPLIKYLCGMKNIRTNLESLKLSFESEVYELCLYTFISKFKNLKRISFARENPETPGLRMLLRDCPLLEEISATGFSIATVNFTSLCLFRHNLSNIVIQSDNLNEDHLRHLLEFPKLRNLELKDGNPTPKKLREIGKLECVSRLHLLEMRTSSVLSAKHVTEFFRNGTFINLRELKLHQSRVDDESAVEIRRKCVNVEYLEIRTYPKIRSNMTDKALVQFLHCKKLQHFEVYFDNGEETDWLYRRKRYTNHVCDIDSDCTLDLDALLDNWDEILIPIE